MHFPQFQGFESFRPSLYDTVVHSYAHNSRLYSHLSEKADLASIVEFLCWDAVQPPFNEYLRLWLPKAPDDLREKLMEHIDVEERERHSLLFRQMHEYLLKIEPVRTTIDKKRLANLNYTFSGECANERDFGFFLGGFYATEIMSAKRCELLMQGLIRLGIGETFLEYLRIHAIADISHHLEILDLMIIPYLCEKPHEELSIWAGVRDRLERSAEYLKWYEKNILGLIGS